MAASTPLWVYMCALRKYIKELFLFKLYYFFGEINYATSEYCYISQKPNEILKHYVREQNDKTYFVEVFIT